MATRMRMKTGLSMFLPTAGRKAATILVVGAVLVLSSLARAQNCGSYVVEKWNLEARKHCCGDSPLW